MIGPWFTAIPFVPKRFLFLADMIDSVAADYILISKLESPRETFRLVRPFIDHNSIPEKKQIQMVTLLTEIVNRNFDKI